MFSPRFRAALVAAAGSVALTGCATYDPYGYSGVSVGYGSPYYGGYGYGSPYYGGGYYGRGYAPYYGWYNGYYYPGTGIYVYDRYRRPHRWTESQRRYWQGRRERIEDRREIRQNWRDFRTERVQDRRAYRVERREDPSASQRHGHPRRVPAGPA